MGVVITVIALCAGSGLSGVVLYSYYEYRLDQNEDRVGSFVNGFDERFRTASETIDAETQNAQADIQKELEPLRQFQAEGGTVAQLVERINNSVWFVETLDEAGAPSVGSAFVVESNDTEAVAVTSYSVVKAATANPGPDVNVSKRGEKMKVRVDNWVEDKDLAVITIPKGNLPKIDWVPSDQQPRLGERTFVASGLGASGASVSQGFINDVSEGAIQHDAPVGVQFRGGPLLNSNGQVTGVASMAFAPFGFQSQGGVTFADPIRVTCDKLLRCPAGSNEGGAAAPR